MKLGRQGAALQIQQFCQIRDLITPPDTSHLYKKVAKKAFLKGNPNATNILFSVVFTPSPQPATTAMFGYFLSSLYFERTQYRYSCMLVYLYDLKGFVGTKNQKEDERTNSSIVFPL
jgi:hypothetical protein